MTLWLRESGGAIKGAVEYNTDLFSAQRVQRFVGHYKQLLTAIVNNPQQRVSELPLLTETEQQLLQGFNDTARALPQDELMCVPALRRASSQDARGSGAHR